MHARTLIILIVAAALLLGVALVAVSNRGPDPLEEPGRFAPDLESRLNDVTSITVSGETSFTLSRGADGWSIDEKGGYPADPEKVRAALIGLARLDRVERKTSKPDLYDRLGVGGVGKPDSTVVALEADGAPVGEMILGKRDAAGAEQRYARNADEASSWLVRGRLDLATDTLGWIDREILRIPREDVASVSIEHPDGERLVVHRPDAETTDFVVDEIPEGSQLTRPSAANGLGSSLSFLRLEDVRPDTGEVAEGIVVVISTFDRMVATIRLVAEDDGTWATFGFFAEADAPPGEGFVPDFEGEGPPPEPEVQAIIDKANDLERRLKPWSFRLADSAAAAFDKRVADYIELIPAPDPPPAATEEAGTDGTDTGEPGS